MKEKLFIFLFIIVIFSIFGAVEASKLDELAEINKEKDNITLAELDNFISVLNGTQECTFIDDTRDISCIFNVDDSDQYKFYQDFIALQLKPELENIENIIYDKFISIDNWNFKSYDIYYKGILLAQYNPISLFNHIIFTEDIFKPFLDNFTTTANFKFIPRDSTSIFEPQFYNNSIFEKVTLHAYFTNFLDEDGNKGKAGFLAMQDKTVSEIYYDIPNDGLGHSIWHGYDIALENKIISYDMIITQIDIGEEVYTFEYEFDYDNK